MKVFYFLENSFDIEISIYVIFKSKTRILYIFIDYFIRELNNYTDVRQFLLFDQVNLFLRPSSFDWWNKHCAQFQ